MREMKGPPSVGFIGELQAAINHARKMENQLGKLEVARQDTTRQWKAWEEELRLSYN